MQRNPQLLAFQHPRRLSRLLSFALHKEDAIPEFLLKDKPISPYYWRDKTAELQAVCRVLQSLPSRFVTFSVDDFTPDEFPVLHPIQDEDRETGLPTIL